MDSFKGDLLVWLLFLGLSGGPIGDENLDWDSFRYVRIM